MLVNVQEHLEAATVLGDHICLAPNSSEPVL